MGFQTTFRIHLLPAKFASVLAMLLAVSSCLVLAVFVLGDEDLVTDETFDVDSTLVQQLDVTCEGGLRAEAAAASVALVFGLPGFRGLDRNCPRAISLGAVGALMPGKRRVDLERYFDLVIHSEPWP